MKKLGIVVGIIWLVASIMPAHATENGILPSDGSPGSTQNSAPRTSLIEAWNDNGMPGHTGRYSSLCFAFEYVPSVSYTLERIDLYAGNIAGTVTLSVRDGSLNGGTLASVTYQETPPRDWQGADLVPAIPVLTGSSYFLVYEIVRDAQISAASSGTPISHWHDPNLTCSNWSGPHTSIPWRARFYGALPTPTEPSTWGNIKSVYH
jgi:hypothetical protein